MATTYYEDGTKSKRKGNKNPILDAARNLLGNKKNVSPAATFYKNQKKKADTINKLLNN